MCPKTNNEIVAEAGDKQPSSGVSTPVAVSFMVFCGAVTVASLVAAIVLSGKVGDTKYVVAAQPPAVVVNTTNEIEVFPTMKPPAGEN
eukprot:scaffold14284_cov117-Cylindrotheca_fusiformis.AAC.1